MPKYRYTGKLPYINSMYGINVKPGEEIETRIILDDIDGFERIDDFPPPYSDFSTDYSLNPGDVVIIDKSVFEGMHQLGGYKIADESESGTNVAYLYIDSISDNTDNIIDNNSTVNIKGLSYRKIQKFILKADESNQGKITVRISFGFDTIC